MEKILRARNVLPLEHFISIRFKIEFPHRLTGHLYYLRKDYKAYKLAKGDSLDNAILEAIRGYAAKAEVVYRATLITEEQLADAIRINKGGAERWLSMFFYTNDARQWRNGETKAVEKRLRATFWSDNEESISHSFIKDILVPASDECIKLLNSLKEI